MSGKGWDERSQWQGKARGGGADRRTRNDPLSLVAQLVQLAVHEQHLDRTQCNVNVCIVAGVTAECALLVVPAVKDIRYNVVDGEGVWLAKEKECRNGPVDCVEAEMRGEVVGERRGVCGEGGDVLDVQRSEQLRRHRWQQERESERLENSVAPARAAFSSPGIAPASEVE